MVASSAGIKRKLGNESSTGHLERKQKTEHPASIAPTMTDTYQKVVIPGFNEAFRIIKKATQYGNCIIVDRVNSDYTLVGWDIDTLAGHPRPVEHCQAITKEIAELIHQYDATASGAEKECYFLFLKQFTKLTADCKSEIGAFWDVDETLCAAAKSQKDFKESKDPKRQYIHKEKSLKTLQNVRENKGKNYAITARSYPEDDDNYLSIKNIVAELAKNFDGYCFTNEGVEKAYAVEFYAALEGLMPDQCIMIDDQGETLELCDLFGYATALVQKKAGQVLDTHLDTVAGKVAALVSLRTSQKGMPVREIGDRYLDTISFSDDVIEAAGRRPAPA